MNIWALFSIFREFLRAHAHTIRHTNNQRWHEGSTLKWPFSAVSAKTFKVVSCIVHNSTRSVWSCSLKTESGSRSVMKKAIQPNILNQRDDALGISVTQQCCAQVCVLFLERFRVHLLGQRKPTTFRMAKTSKKLHNFQEVCVTQFFAKSICFEDGEMFQKPWTDLDTTSCYFKKKPYWGVCCVFASIRFPSKHSARAKKVQEENDRLEKLIRWAE